MEERKLALLGGIFLFCLFLLGGVWWMKQRADRAERIEGCVAMLGEQGRAKCEEMERGR